MIANTNKSNMKKIKPKYYEFYCRRSKKIKQKIWDELPVYVHKVYDKIAIYHDRKKNFSHLVAFRKSGYNTNTMPVAIRSKMEKIYFSWIEKQIKKELKKIQK